MTVGYSNEPFQGYLFNGSPPRQPRLWFLDRHLTLLLVSGWTVGPFDNIDVGTWSTDKDVVRNRLDEWSGGGTALEHIVLGLSIRYQNLGTDEWTAVWRLTDVTIPRDPADARRGNGITTFGRDDDVWRLGIWPD